MSTPVDENERIEDVAALWLAEREEGFSTPRAREFDRWCRADARHAAAIARLEQACALLEEMPQVRAELQPVVEFPSSSARLPRPVARGPWLRIALGIAAAVALVAAGLWQWSRPTVLRYSTSAGGYERVVLTDGSVLELNANTEVQVAFVARERRVSLVAGEAHFTVAHDTARPFIVGAGHVSVRAVGTAFNVRFGTAAVEVLVTEGKVQLGHTAAPAAPAKPASAEAALNAGASPTLLAASERLVIPASYASAPALPGGQFPAIEKISPEMMHAALAWQERKLVFAETPLRDVVVQFNRRNRLQLTVTDPALGARPVGGTFAADNVEGFVRLLENSGTVAVEHRGDFEIVLRPKR